MKLCVYVSNNNLMPMHYLPLKDECRFLCAVVLTHLVRL